MSTSDPLIGKQLGDYKIEELIGHGGMARVYRGFDETLDRNAAVKVIEPTLIASGEEEEYRDRFLREARAIARLNHPNIVGIYQFAQSENFYFIAMAYLDGRDLREQLKDYIDQKKLMPRDEMIKVLHDIASGLDYAHKNSIIHRDIKPSNIIITKEGNAVLTDFGLALNAVEGTIGNTFGSVHYIAPEQAISSAQAVPQSDQYSVGVIVYEMLAGQVPFDDASAMSVALKHISDLPPPIRDTNPNVSPELEAVVMRALDKEPTNRYASVTEFIKAFEKALESSPDALATTPLKLGDSPIPNVTPSNNDDAPTLDRPIGASSSVNAPIPSSKSQTTTEKSGGMNMTIVVVVVVVIVAILAGAVLASNSAAQAASATETAVAQANATETAVIVAENETATQEMIVASTATTAAEATEVANTNATLTVQAEVTSTAEFEATEVANTNATLTVQAEVTSTAEFEATETANANATGTALAQVDATTTAEFEATETANTNATETALAQVDATTTAEFEATESALAQAEATDTAATATEIFVLTQDALPSATPSSTPTLTPTMTPSVTSSPTMLPSPTLTMTPTQVALVAETGEAQLLLRYDGRSMLMTNRLPDSSIRIDLLVFTKFVKDDNGDLVKSDAFRMSEFTGAPSPLDFRGCLQIWNGRQFAGPSDTNMLMEGICDAAPFWRTSNAIFWADTERDQYFEVTLNGVDLLATCPTSRLGSLTESRCVIDLPGQ